MSGLKAWARDVRTAAAATTPTALAVMVGGWIAVGVVIILVGA